MTVGLALVFLGMSAAILIEILNLVVQFIRNRHAPYKRTRFVVFIQLVGFFLSLIGITAVLCRDATVLF